MNNDQWQNGKSLPECLGYMLKKEIACDVTFIVGEEKTEMKAHTTILISRSPVFYAMLNGPLKETNAITVPDIEPDVFKHVMRYMYTDEIKLTEETVIQVLYAAKKYCLDGLSQQCSDFLSSSITDENVLMLFEQAHVFDDQNLERKCVEKIKENPKKCIEGSSFLDLCHTCCEKIIASDDLGVVEEFIYERVMQWSETECARQELDVSDVNKRKVLNSILYKVRFPLLDKDYFARHLFKSNLLTSDEKVEVMSCYLEIPDSSRHKFNNKTRNCLKVKHNVKLIRYKRVNGGWCYNSNKPDKITFVASEDIYLCGVVLYGDEKSSEYQVDLKLLDERDITVASIKMKYVATVPGYMSDIILKTPVLIDAYKNYKVVALISGPYSKYGDNGVSPVIAKGITITFSNSCLDNSNSTDIFRGQIPGLLFSSRR